MKLFWKTALICFSAGMAMGQTPVYTIGDESGLTDIQDPEVTAFRNYDSRYLMFSAYSMKDGRQNGLQGFKSDNSYLCDTKIRVPEENMVVSIYEGIANLDNNLCLFKSVFRKEDKKCYLYAYKLDDHGNIGEEKKEITFINAEKALNSGNYSIAASPNGQYAVILSEMPFVKETKEKIAVTLIDKTLKTIYTKEVELPYDARRGEMNEPVVCNNGTVHIIKKAQIAKMPDILTVFSFSGDGQTMKENIVKLDDPKKFTDYIYTTQADGSLLLGGYYTEDGKVTFGGTKLKGTFMMKVLASGNQDFMQVSAFEKAVTYMKLRYLIPGPDGKIFMGAEAYIVSDNSSMGPNQEILHSKSYDQGFIQLYFFDEKGNLKRNSEISKTHKSVNDGGLYGSFFAASIAGKLMIIYNDYQYKHDGKEHKVVGPALASIQNPIFQTLDFDGNPGKEYMDTDNGVGGKNDRTNLLPLTGLKISDNEFFFLGSRGTACHPISVKLQ